MKRKPNKTILIRVEGENDEVFLRYLKWLYYERGSGFIITIESAGGKGPNNVIHPIKNKLDYSSYVCMIDKDLEKETDKKSYDLIKRFKIDIIWNDKCLDAFMLSILNNGKSYCFYESSYCKEEFRKKYLNGSNKFTNEDCKKIFDKNILDNSRGKINNLDKIISILNKGL